MKAIIRRELKFNFTSARGWVFLAVFFFIYDLYFWAYNLKMGNSSLSYSVSACVYVCIVTVPILTVQDAAKDCRIKSDHNLRTSPVSILKVVFGKFISLLIIFSVAIGLICLCTPVMGAFGTVVTGESYMSVLGLWLFGMLSISIGLFLSVLAKSRVIAAVLSYAVLIFGYMMGSVSSLISESDSFFAKILGCLAIVRPAQNFLNGIFDVAGVVYYVAAALMFLSLSCFFMQGYCRLPEPGKIRRGAVRSLYAVITVVIAVVINMMAAQLPDNLRNIDVTYQKLYTLTEDSCRLMDALEQDVTIYVLAAERDVDYLVKKTLDCYEGSSDYITVEYADPAVSPDFYTAYTDTEPSEGSLIVVSEGRSKVIDYEDIYEYTADNNTYTKSISAYDGEGQITSAVSYVTAGNAGEIYIVSGHGEADLGPSFAAALEKMNFSVGNLVLITEDAVPENAAALIINGPTADFSEDDAQKVIDYLDGGGRVLITTSCEAEEEMLNFSSVLAECGIQVQQGVVMESDTLYYYQYPYYLLPRACSGSAALNADGVVVAYAQSLINNDTESGTKNWTTFLETSEHAYLKANVKTMITYSKEDGDEEGTFILGSQMINSETGAELTVIGSVLIFNDNLDSYVSGKNMALFKGIVSRFSSSEVTVSIDAKEYSYGYLSLSKTAVRLSAIILIVLIPLGLITPAILMWVRKRKG